MALDPETREQLISSVARFVRERLVPIEDQVSREDRIPDEIIAEMRELGLFGLSIPVEYGGLGLTMEEEALVLFELCQTSPAFRSAIGTNIGIGSQGLVMFVRGHLHDLHAQGRPEGARPFQTVKRGERRGCDHADAAVAQVGPSVGHPFLLGPGDRVPAHERCSAPFVGLDFGHDPPLGAARVGHEQSWSTVTRSRDRVAAHSRDGGADYHDVRFGDGPVQALGPFVDRPDAEGLVDCGRIATDADHAAGQMTSARGQSD